MALTHAAFTLAHRLRRLYWRIARPKVQGVKLVVLRGDAVLLVRHSYQASDLFMLPGGGVKRGETIEQAGQREAREEAGVAVTALQLHGEFVSTREGARNHISVLVGTTGDEARADGREIVEARFFGLHALPDAISPASLRRIEEVRDGMPPADDW